MTQLSAAVASLYSVFARYPRRDDMPACTCCVHSADRHTLRRVPLRDLAAEDLGRYAGKAMTTWGEAVDYKHFLPRILELVAHDEAGWIGLDLELIADKLRGADWTTWPTIERDIIARYFDALWLHTLTDSEDDPERVDEVLRAVTHITRDGQRPLSTWETQPGWRATLCIAAMIERHAQEVTGGRLTDTTTWRNASAFQALIEWLREPARQQRLEDAFAAHVDAPGADRVAHAIDLLSWPR